MKKPVLFCCIFCCSLHIAESVVNYTILNNIPGDEFDCGSNVTVQCKLPSAPPFFTWKIAEDAKTTSTFFATCSGGFCTPTSSAPPNYFFTYDASNITSSVTIASVDFNDDKLQFLCDIFSSPSIPTSSVIEIPSDEETSVSNTTTDNKIIFRMETNCVFPVNSSSFNVTWVRMKDGHEESLDDVTSTLIEDVRSTLEPCSNFTGCTVNGSSKIVSELNITELNAGEQWIVGVKVKFKNFDEYAVNATGSYYFSASTTNSTYSSTTTTITTTETEDASASTTTIAPTTLSSSTTTTATTAPTITTASTQVSSSPTATITTTKTKDVSASTTTTAPTTLSSSTASSSSTTTTTSPKSSAVKEYTITTIAVVSSIGLFMVVSVTFIILYVNGRRWLRRRERNRRQMGHFYRHRTEIRPDSELSIMRM